MDDLSSQKHDDPALQRVDDILSSMPPVRAMAICVVGMDAGRMRLSAPLTANINDKGCAFGGSLSALMTLACWSLCAVQLDRRGHRPDIYVQDSSVRYLLPLDDDLLAEAAADVDWDAMAASLVGRGRARAQLQALIRLPDGRPAATLEGRFVAIAANRNSPDQR
ncbi:MAG: YiiD C-terminal domain-containing protein [Xanthomonadales bacterium]|nr:YiiD C-terminal domain-containing protein [Xanthomonadales bacterium]